eukprot:1160026-Pelagomonas_calceolata.AAC.15
MFTCCVTTGDSQASKSKDSCKAHLLRYHREHFNVNAVELIEACPCPALRQAAEKLALQAQVARCGSSKSKTVSNASLMLAMLDGGKSRNSDTALTIRNGCARTAWHVGEPMLLSRPALKNKSCLVHTCYHCAHHESEVQVLSAVEDNALDAQGLAQVFGSLSLAYKFSTSKGLVVHID